MSESEVRERYAREIVDVLVDGLRHEKAVPGHLRSAALILARYRDEVLEEAAAAVEHGPYHPAPVVRALKTDR